MMGKTFICGRAILNINLSSNFRRDDFHNPYDRKAIKEQLQLESLQKMEEALRKKQEQKKLDRKKKKTKKPSLSRTEL